MKCEVKKYLIIGLESEKDAFFQKAQTQGFIEFIPASGPKKIAFPKSLTHFTEALKLLKPYETENPDVLTGDAHWACHQIIDLKHKLAALYDEERAVNQEIMRVKIFGDFSKGEIHEIEKDGKRAIQFFAVKERLTRNGNLPEELIYIGTEFDMDYFISISKKPLSEPNLIEMQIERPLGELQNRLNDIHKERHSIQSQLKGFAAWKTHIQNTLIEKLNSHNLQSAKTEVDQELDGSLFAVFAWIPTKKLSQTTTLIQNFSIHCELASVEKDDKVPTYLENKGFSKVGEDLVHIYDVPAAEDKDPSPWVIWAFVLFFSMIVADAGYGLIYFTVALLLRHKCKKAKGGLKRFITLLTTISIGCMTWGILTCSYFGLTIKPSNPISKYSMIGYLANKKASYHMAEKDDVYQFWVQKNPELEAAQTPTQFLTTEHKGLYPIYEAFSDNILLELAIFVGLIHLTLSLMRYSLRSWPNFGWIIFLIGGYLYFPSHMDATSFVNFLGILSKPLAAAIGLQCVIIGLIISTVLALIQMKLAGLAEITKMIQVFSDTLSYLRLYALGLAGMMMAATFNDLAVDAGLFLGFFILIAGHALNFTMGAVSGIIHGLRLNFLEWYHYSFEGGGRIFNPLKRLKTKQETKA